MATLVHEIWQEPFTLGGGTAVCLAGPDGVDFRRTLAPGTRLVHRFKADSHFDAMTYYYGFERRGVAYTATHASDGAPYPEEWATRQRDAESNLTKM
jgi:hypothetical protein